MCRGKKIHIIRGHFRLIIQLAGVQGEIIIPAEEEVVLSGRCSIRHSVLCSSRRSLRRSSGSAAWHSLSVLFEIVQANICILIFQCIIDALEGALIIAIHRVAARCLRRSGLRSLWLCRVHIGTSAVIGIIIARSPCGTSWFLVRLRFFVFILHAAQHLVESCIRIVGRLLRFLTHRSLLRILTLCTDAGQLILEAAFLRGLVCKVREDIVVQVRISGGPLSLRFRKDGLSARRMSRFRNRLALRSLISQSLIFCTRFLVLLLLENVDEVHRATALSRWLLLAEQLFLQRHLSFRFPISGRLPVCCRFRRRLRRTGRTLRLVTGRERIIIVRRAVPRRANALRNLLPRLAFLYHGAPVKCHRPGILILVFLLGSPVQIQIKTVIRFTISIRFSIWSSIVYGMLSCRFQACGYGSRATDAAEFRTVSNLVATFTTEHYVTSKNQLYPSLK